MANPADLMTKELAANDIDRHVQNMEGGRVLQTEEQRLPRVSLLTKHQSTYATWKRVRMHSMTQILTMVSIMEKMRTFSHKRSKVAGSRW